ncbi:MAG: OmpA family protein [Bacteroidales bacterium]|nr:OmpA family protein [Bacteroidales bacterium]
MKRITIIALLTSLCSILSIQILNAQISPERILRNTQRKTERKVENRIEKRIDKKVDKALDEVEDSMDGKKKTEKPKESQEETSKKESGSPVNNSGTENKNASENEPVKQEKPLKPELTWSKFDFVPGDVIIFEDNQEGEQNGEFPSKWDLAGGLVENANFGGDNVIMFRKCNINGADGIVPLLKNTKEDYLPEEFTIEFDAWFEKPNHTYRVYLMDSKNQKNLDPSNNSNNRFYLRFNQNSADGRNISKGYYPGFSNANSSAGEPGWRHISISFNKRALKCYIDDARVINIPNMEANPVGLTLGFHNPSGKINGYIKNIRIAKGAVPLYDKVLTDGKFITTGIKFDVNKANIRAESFGTINYVVKMMQDNPDLKFSVEGHTDSDGDDALNMKLSEARAKAVMDQLVEMGIAKDRLTSKGHGESNPMVANDTPEGKAQNRRVEFVKF